MPNPNKKFQGALGTIYLRDVPRGVRDSFHAECVRRGKSMKSMILEFMRDFARDARKLRFDKKDRVTAISEKLVVKFKEKKEL